MARAKSTGGRSPVKKSSGKTPKRNTTPRKKSKTPSRKPSKSPAKRARSRSVSKSRATPKKTTSTRKFPAPKRSPSKSPSKSSPVAKKATPRGRSRSRSQQSSVRSSSGRRTPTIGQKIKDTAHVIEHKISSPIASLASNLRSRRAAYDNALNRVNSGGYTTSSSSSRRPATQGLWNYARNSRAGNFIRNIPRRVRFNNIKRHFKKNWRRYATLAFAGIAAYYSYQNKKAIERALNEQYVKLASLVEQQKGSTFSKYFSGWYDDNETTTQTPQTIPPRTVDQQQVPQPQHHATKTT